MPVTTDSDDAVAALRDLARQRAKLLEQIEAAMAEHLVTARLERRFDAAVAASGLSRTACLRLTRRRNEKGGRSIRWSDGLDPVNSSYAST